MTPPPAVVAIIPAHNEARNIAATLASLRHQTDPPDRILVVADNCTDDTVGIARADGAEVHETAGNTAKKAGALNQGLAAVLPSLRDSDQVLIMDADSELVPTWIADAREAVAAGGAVSGAYVARREAGWLPMLQHVEYAQERLRIDLRGGRVNVLSGAASMFRADVLRHAAAARGVSIPGCPGDVYDTRSLTEDFELTLALQALGYTPLSPSRLRVVTDVMGTWRELYGQRLRWQRGYLETLRSYPLRQTWWAWAVQAWVYGTTVVPFLMIALMTHSVLTYGLAWEPLWLTVIPVFMVLETLAARRSGRRGMALAASIVPLWLYNGWRGAVYWTALAAALQRRTSAWT
jgi:poly-beta-1,6-N-acetyl-D-glucosamine synthase